MNIRALNETQQTVGVVIEGETGFTTCSLFVFCEWQADQSVRWQYVLRGQEKAQLGFGIEPSMKGRLTVYDLPTCSIVGQAEFPEIGRMVVTVATAGVGVDLSTRVEVDKTLSEEAVDC